METLEEYGGPKLDKEAVVGGIRVEGLGFWVEGFGFRVEGSGFRVEGLGWGFGTTVDA